MAEGSVDSVPAAYRAVEHGVVPEIATRPRRSGLASVALAIAVSALTIAISALSNRPGAARTAGILGFGAASLLGAISVVLGFKSVQRRAGGPWAAALDALVRVVSVVGGGFMFLAGAFAAYLSTVSFTRGRQIRDGSRVMLPDLEPGDAWTRLLPDARIDGTEREALAAQWRANGRTEHASVAAFAQLTLDLVALGAPPRLIEAANRDALDEIRHAELCFSIARALDGRTESPAPFPRAAQVHRLPAPRTWALARLAVDSLIDGALNEGVSARVVSQLKRRCTEPTIRAVLERIAADEGRHSSHGWHVVQWCLATGGAPVAHALRGALSALPTTIAPTLPPAALDGAWEPFGIQGRALEEAQYAATKDHVVRRTRALIALPPRRAA